MVFQEQNWLTKDEMRFMVLCYSTW